MREVFARNDRHAESKPARREAGELEILCAIPTIQFGAHRDPDSRGTTRNIRDVICGTFAMSLGMGWQSDFFRARVSLGTWGLQRLTLRHLAGVEMGLELAGRQEGGVLAALEPSHRPAGNPACRGRLDC